MRYVRICLAAFMLMGIFAVSNISSAADWYYVNKGSSGGTFFIDNDSVKKNKEEAVLWIRVVGENGESVLYRTRINHNSRMVQYLNAIAYDKSGNVVATHNQPTAWEPIPPDSMMESIYNLIW